MTVGEGKFLLYSYLTPALTAGSYRFTTSQKMSATAADGTALDGSHLPVSDLQSFVDVTSPRYQLPPDQVLSTYPPANSEGSYGSRLPQIVIKRRTLPWERDVGTGDATTPWLALVLVAEGEAELVLNRPVAECFTPGLHVEGAPDVAQGSYLSVRKSVIDRIFPTQKDVPLLAHAREVDIHDTELMMGDDDGFLAVVIANRLPVAGHDGAGNEVPVKYLACLVNLEGQFPVLLPQAPEPVFRTVLPYLEAQPEIIGVAAYDQRRMGNDETYRSVTTAPVAHAAAVTGAVASSETRVSPDPIAVGQVRPGHWDLVGATSAQSVYEQMAAPFGGISVSGELLDPTYRFPVLLHWSFTSVGDTTFRSLLEGLDNGLLSTLPGNRPFGAHPDDPDRTPRELDGRPPLEVVETGHVGLAQRTRLGDQVRAWYRGPLLPHPPDTAAARLPLAHAGDQLRAVIPDGREDLSLAAAFEIGRLLALSSPAMVAALMSWRQDGYQTARLETVWGTVVQQLQGWLGVQVAVASDVGVRLGRGFVGSMSASPGAVLGQPRLVSSPGTPLPVDGPPLDLVLNGYGIGGLPAGGDLLATLGALRGTPVPRLPLNGLTPSGFTTTVRDELSGVLDDAVTRLTRDALAPALDLDPALGPTFVGWQPAARPHPDRLDEMLGHGPAQEDES